MTKKIISAAGIVIGSILTLAQNSAAEDITSRLKRANNLFLVNETIRPYLYDQNVTNRLGQWLNHYKNQSYVIDCQFNMRAFFRSEKILGPLCYFLRQDDKTKRQGFLPFVDRYVQEMGSALAEIAEDPRFSDSDRLKAKSMAEPFKRDDRSKLKDCFDPAMKVDWPADGAALSFTPFSAIGKCFHENFPKTGSTPYFAVNIAKEFPNHPGHAVSPTGWIPGNRSSYYFWNNTTAARRDELDVKHDQMKQNYPLNGAGSLNSMRSADLSKVFSDSEGFTSIDNDPVWSETNDGAIFPMIKSSLDNAKKTIFIDVFFLGSSMGASLAKHLVTLAEKGIKIMILRDNTNHFGHEPEMRPIFNFLAAYSEKNPAKLVISGSYIKGHSSGLPSFIAPVLTDDFLEKSGIQQHLSLYGRAQSDHSKVFVIDGNTPTPTAFVGSKNLTDASGAITYDEVIKIEGPAAAAVLDDYYWDMVYALRHEVSDALIKIYAQKGWSSSFYSSGQSRDAMVANILKPFDLLDRNEKGQASSSAKVVVTEVGTAKIRTGQNNVNSTRTNCLDQVVQMILAAKTNIYIKDQYLFDRNVILALLQAKKSQPSIDIKILLEPMDRANPRGMPNLLYLDILKSAGMQIRWKKLVEPKSISSEYHMKTISADGTSVITGSANKDQTTMYGAFREEQVDVWDAATTKVHDDILRKHWNDQESEAFIGYNFKVPYNLKGFDGKEMTASQFIALIRDVVSVLFDAQTVN